MTRRRRLLDHGLIFAAALLTLPLAAVTGEATGAFLGGIVLVAGIWIAIAATLRLEVASAVLPTIAAMTLLLIGSLSALAATERPSTCPPGQTGFMDCGLLFETTAGPAVVLFLVLTGALAFFQLLVLRGAGPVRRRLPPSARLPTEQGHPGRLTER